jgi:polyisoprenoid-binding protein YceI
MIAMKTFRRRFTFSAVLFLAAALQAQTLTAFKAQPTGSKMKIDGTSTVHDWSMEGTLIGGSLELDAAFLAAPDKAAPGKIAAKAQALVPVRSLKSGKDSMDAVMQDAMKQDKFPRIEYQLSELKLKEAPKAANGPFLFESTGNLIIAGVTNKVAFPVTIEKLDGGKLKTTGGTAVKMTAYGITPPAPKVALGLVKTGDDIKISFEWVTAPVTK